MVEEEKPLSYYVLNGEKYKEFQENLAEILAETKKRGEVWLYPLPHKPSRNGFIVIWIYGDRKLQFLFEASARKYRQELESQGEKITETAEDMLLSRKYAWLWEVKTKTPAFIKKHYPKIKGLPIRFFSGLIEAIDYERHYGLKEKSRTDKINL